MEERIKNLIFTPPIKPLMTRKVNFHCFEIIDRAFSYFRLQIKEAMHIN